VLLDHRKPSSQKRLRRKPGHSGSIKTRITREPIMSIGDIALDDAAKDAAGNWRRFHCFVWFRERDLDDADDWAVCYTHNRDSGLLDQSNAAVIEKELEPFTEGDDPDVVPELHSHWVVGHVDGFSLRVFKDGQITEAFKKYHKLSELLDDYPILDEQDYS